MEVPESPEAAGGAGSGTDPAGAPGTGAEAAAAAATGRRRHGRAAPLIAGAAAPGVLAGVCTGYLVQAGRPPTGLPPLSQPVVRRAEGDVVRLTARRTAA
ncbi:hypothetical protein QQY24_17300 [Streptomyces sp. TG1A-8]|uniref:hypothetical protein n=1 Tax=Streptomyces sp. TG1A-8 TaxID=3051385 RepID=UPI00265BFB13|nr:hypothetical protein [Streptomyces sp. TG1A-8]MDO0927082.1 hypothetical protein [Streptomyces sp. TG1A-8]